MIIDSNSKKKKKLSLQNWMNWQNKRVHEDEVPPANNKAEVNRQSLLVVVEKKKKKRKLVKTLSGQVEYKFCWSKENGKQKITDNNNVSL